MVEGIRNLIRRPGDVALLLRVGVFVARAPKLVEQYSVRDLLAALRSMRGKCEDPQRIIRMRKYWLCRPQFSSHDTCYIRALTLYRFLETNGEPIGLHLGVEHREHRDARLHGHAWVSLGDRILEGPPAALEGRLREIHLRAAR
jgi:hypothetical protein